MFTIILTTTATKRPDFYTKMAHKLSMKRLIYQTLFYIEIISFKIEIHITIPGLHSEQDVDPVLLAQDPGEHF